MKQEITQVVETKYGFDRCEKTEFVRQMTREFAKYEKKLAKINNYEKMLGDGKELSKEVLELVGKKQSFLAHIKVLRSVTDIYVKTSSQHTQAVLEAMDDKVKAEVEKKVQEELKKVSDFFVVAETLKERDHIVLTPLTKVPREKQEAILATYGRLTRLSRNRDTTMREEAEKLRGDLTGLLESGEMGEYVEGVMKSEVADAGFRISEGPEYEFVMLQPADRLEMSEQVKMDANSQLPKANGLLNRVKESLACPENKIKEVRLEESKQEIVKPEGPVLERSERECSGYGKQSETPSLVNASQETEFEIAMSKPTRRELNRKMRQTGKEADDDEDECERKFLNRKV